MPFIEFHIERGLSESRKLELLRRTIEVVHESIDDDPKLVNVVVHEYPAENLMVSGRVKDRSLDNV
jgi:4-oxalocrotonate tautomerase/trans-3-chloroacrylic acid dehalogenase beta subunit